MNPYADLRARLARLAAAAPPEQLARHPGGWTRCRTYYDHPHAPHQLSYDPWRACPGLADAFIVALVNAYPEIDALLARGEAAEADAEAWKAIAKANEGTRMTLEEFSERYGFGESP